MKPSHITRFGRPLQVAALVLMPGMSGVEAQQLTVQQVRQTLVLGGLDVPEWQAFSWEPSLHLDRSGRLYLRPPGEARVTIVDTEGRFVRHVGRRGEGPRASFSAWPAWACWVTHCGYEISRFHGSPSSTRTASTSGRSGRQSSTPRASHRLRASRLCSGEATHLPPQTETYWGVWNGCECPS